MCWVCAVAGVSEGGMGCVEDGEDGDGLSWRAPEERGIPMVYQ